MYRITQFSGEKAKPKLASVGGRKMAFKKREVACHFPLFGYEFPAGPLSVVFVGLGMVVWGRTSLLPAVALKGYSY